MEIKNINNNNNFNNDNKINKEYNNLTLYDSIKTNYLSWIFILISIYIISYPNINKGIITFIFLIFISYFIHKYSHFYRNIFTILHHYHHENNNIFSHFSQILLEISLGFGLIMIKFIYPNYMPLDVWTIILFIFFYSTVHNYNYGILHINNVHYLHHKYIHSNIGPDICDIIFNTKNKEDLNIENTNHYIPNIIIGTIFVLFIKFFFNNNSLNNIYIYIFIIITILIFLFLFFSSVYLLFTYK